MVKLEDGQYDGQWEIPRDMKKQIHFFMRCEEANVNSSVSMMKIHILNYIKQTYNII